MIDYEVEGWHVNLLLKWQGSVFPAAISCAMPSAIVAFLICYYHETLDPSGSFSLAGEGVNSMWSAYTFILGFLVVFRTQQAYGRYWEGVTLLRQARGEWFNAYSSLIAFSTVDVARKAEVESFQHQIARLFSILNCVALQTITVMEDDDFPTLEVIGLNVESLQYLASKKDHNQRMEILIQWIQKVVVNNMGSQILTVPAPVMTRFFQELSRGTVSMNQARNMTEIPFPFPYAQLLTLLLVLNSVMTPIISAVLMRNYIWSPLFTFILSFAFWGANYIAAEIESPFGDDQNDLPLRRLQEDVNASLWTLLEVHSQNPPSFLFNKQIHRSYSTRRKSFSFVEGEEVHATPASFSRMGSRVSLQSRASVATHCASPAAFLRQSSCATSGSAPRSSISSGFGRQKKKKPGFAGSHVHKLTSRLRRSTINLDDVEADSSEGSDEMQEDEEPLPHLLQFAQATRAAQPRSRGRTELASTSVSGEPAVLVIAPSLAPSLQADAGGRRWSCPRLSLREAGEEREHPSETYASQASGRGRGLNSSTGACSPPARSSRPCGRQELHQEPEHRGRAYTGPNDGEASSARHLPQYDQESARL